MVDRKRQDHAHRRRAADALRKACRRRGFVEALEPRRLLSGTPSITGTTLSSPTIDENGVLVLTGTYSDTASSDSLTVNWGDGTAPVTLTVTGGVFVFAHQYLSPSINVSGIQYAFPIQLTLTNSLNQTATAGNAVIVQNVAPSNVTISLMGTTPAAISASPPYATVFEGTTLTLCGAYTDVGTLDTHTVDWHVVASNGQIIADGTGSTYSFTPDNNGPAGSAATYIVTYTVTDNYGGVGSAPPFVVTVVDAPPTIVLTGSATTRAGTPFTLTMGAITDPGILDVVTGYKIDWGDGTVQDFSGAGSPVNVSKSHTYAGGASTTYIVSVTLIDNDGTHTGAGTFTANIISAAGNTIAGRYLFYADSSFDAQGAAAAIATDKTALLPGQTATFANYSSYNLGINGIIVDISGTVGPITAADFAFAVGNNNSPAAWTAAPAPTSVIVLAGAGTGGSNRVEITWADGAILNQWLEVKVLADGNTGLAANDVFFYGNAVGSTGVTPGSAKVTATDQILVRNNLLGNGSTYYVSPTGSDSNSGSASSPWATLQHAADTALAGDTVIVEAGTYTTGMNIIGAEGGTQEDPIRFVANPGAVITHCATEGINANLAGINIENTGGYYLIEGFDVESDGSMTRAGIRVADSNNVTLINNLVDHAYIGIFASDSNALLVQNNTCENSTDQHGIYISGCSQYTILGNTIFGNNWDGLHLNISGDMPNTGGIIENNLIYSNNLSGIDMEGVTNSYFANNVIVGNAKHGITLHNLDQANTPACTGNYFINNTIAGNGGFAIQMAAGGNVLNMLFNNILLGSGGLYGSIGISGDPTGLLSDHNIVSNSFSTDLGQTQITLAQWQAYTAGNSSNQFEDDAASIVAVPSQVFANAALGNYQLYAGSLAVNAGVGVYLGEAAPANDADGGARPAGAAWDIGAYEFGATPNPSAFAVTSSGAPVNDPYDFNRDGRVDAADELIARMNQTTFLTALNLITVPTGLSLVPAGQEIQTDAADSSGPTADVALPGPDKTAGDADVENASGTAVPAAGAATSPANPAVTPAVPVAPPAGLKKRQRAAGALRGDLPAQAGKSAATPPYPEVFQVRLIANGKLPHRARSLILGSDPFDFLLVLSSRQ